MRRYLLYLADKLQEEVMSVITDSRKAEEGCLFVPIVGNV